MLGYDFPAMSRILLVPARETRAEILVVNSRFIATATPAFSLEEAGNTEIGDGDRFFIMGRCRSASESLAGRWRSHLEATGKRQIKED